MIKTDKNGIKMKGNIFDLAADICTIVQNYIRIIKDAEIPDYEKDSIIDALKHTLMDTIELSEKELTEKVERMKGEMLVKMMQDIVKPDLEEEQ